VNNPDFFKRKLKKAQERGYLRTLDLFAGCGGLTLGFHRAGFNCVSAVEINEIARKSHQMNFASHSGHDGYATYSDVTQVDPFTAVGHLLHVEDDAEAVIDVIIGGPPCQPFSRLGRAALWRLAGKDHAHAEDERATMYHYYLEYIARLKPIAFVMENVREIGKFAKKNVAEEVAATADNMGYETRYALLNAVWYGVPQLRERMFIIGIRKELQTLPIFPEITHYYNIPVGYSTSRAGKDTIEVLEPHDHYVNYAEYVTDVKPAVTVAEAFADLPPIYDHLDGRVGKGYPRDTSKKFPYTDTDTDFTREMKNWPDFPSGKYFTGHVIRFTPRDYEIFRRMPAGAMYPEALAIAEGIFQERLLELEKQLGRKIEEGSIEWVQLQEETVPPYKVHRYPNKFRKMSATDPSRTVPAHIGKDSYSHIHFDSNQARGISMREAARLQSFPDGFVLSGSMNEQLKQIGNAVPPLLAFAVAKTLRQILETAASLSVKDSELAMDLTNE
jgi:DNA (cytosine-5)-methyltransferase 1